MEYLRRLKDVFCAFRCIVAGAVPCRLRGIRSAPLHRLCVQFLNTGHKCLEKFPAARVNTDRDIVDVCGRSLLQLGYELRQHAKWEVVDAEVAEVRKRVQGNTFS